MNTQCSPFPELEIEIPRGGYVVRKGLEILSCANDGRRGLILFEDQLECLRYAARLESETGQKLTIRHRSWDHLCRCVAETRMRCIHVVSGGVRTVFVR